MNSVDQPNWWNRNWKWFVPTGCLVIVLLMAGFIGGIFMLVFAMIKQSDAYIRALDAARESPAVVATLGTPIEEGLFTTGNISETGPSGEASLAIPVSGPRGAGTVYVEATKSAGVWRFKTLVFEADGTAKRVDLIEENGDAQP